MKFNEPFIDINMYPNELVSRITEELNRRIDSICEGSIHKNNLLYEWDDEKKYIIDGKPIIFPLFRLLDYPDKYEFRFNNNTKEGRLLCVIFKPKNCFDWEKNEISFKLNYEIY